MSSPSEEKPSETATEYAANGDTPETNAMWSKWNLRKGSGDDIEGPGDFCRRKERECNTLKQQLTEALEKLRVLQANFDAVNQTREHAQESLAELNKDYEKRWRQYCDELSALKAENEEWQAEFMLLIGSSDPEGASGKVADLVCKLETERDTLRQENERLVKEASQPRCAHCGSYMIHQQECPRCGFSKCCDVCCQIATFEIETKMLRAQLASRNQPVSAWIPVSERKPTGADCDPEWDQVIYRERDGLPGICGYNAIPPSATHWASIPPLPDQGELTNPTR